MAASIITCGINVVEYVLPVPNTNLEPMDWVSVYECVNMDATPYRTLSDGSSVKYVAMQWALKWNEEFIE